MSLTLLPDVERLLSAWLRVQPEVSAIVGDRVVTEYPKDKAGPFVVLNRLGGQPRFSRPLWLDDAFIQLSCYGGPKVIAQQLAQTCRAVMADRLTGHHDALGSVSGVTFGSMLYLPDDDAFDPARPRYIVDTTVTVHPLI